MARYLSMLSESINQKGKIMIRHLIMLFITSLVIFSCSGDSTPTTNNQPETGDLNIRLRIIPAGTLNPADVVSMSKAQVVLRKAEVKTSSGTTTSLFPDGPLIVDLATIDTSGVIGTLSLPYDQYTEAYLSVGPLVQSDGGIYTNNRDLQDQSCNVNGFVTTLFTEPFEYTTAFTYETTKVLEQPILISEQQTAQDLLVTIDLSKWFLDTEGSFIDPEPVENKELIDATIMDSIFLDR